MSKFRFTVEMLSPWLPEDEIAHVTALAAIVDNANAALDAHLATLERVYHDACNDGKEEENKCWRPYSHGENCHSALLFDISPLRGEGEGDK